MEERAKGLVAGTTAVLAGAAALGVLAVTVALPGLVEFRAAAALRDAGFAEADVVVDRLGLESVEGGVVLGAGQGIDRFRAEYTLSGLMEGRVDRLLLEGGRLTVLAGPGGAGIKGYEPPDTPAEPGAPALPVGEVLLRSTVLTVETPFGTMSVPVEADLAQPEPGRLTGTAGYRVEPGGLSGSVRLEATLADAGTRFTLVLDPAAGTAEGAPALAGRLSADLPSGGAPRIDAALTAAGFPLPDGASVTGSADYAAADGGHRLTARFETSHGVTAEADAKAVPGAGGVLEAEAKVALAAADLGRLRDGLAGSVRATLAAKGPVDGALPPVAFDLSGKGLLVPGLARAAALKAAGTLKRTEAGYEVEAASPWTLEGKGLKDLPAGLAGQTLFLSLRPPGEGPFALSAVLEEARTTLAFRGALGAELGPYVLGGGVPELRAVLEGGALREAALRLVDGQFTASGAGVAADALALTVDYAAGRKAPLAATAEAGVRGSGAAAWVPAAKARFEASGDPAGVLTAKGALEGAAGSLVLDLKARHDMATASGSADVKLHPVTFLPGARQPQDLFPGLKDTIQEGSGTVAFRSRLGWGPKGPKGDAELLLDRLTLAGPLGAVRELSGVLKASSLSPLVMPPGQLLAIGLLDIGIPLQDGLVAFEVKDGEVLKLDKAEFHWAGGQVRVQPFQSALREHRRTVVLEANGLDLGKVLSLAPVEGLEAAGKLDGRIPLVLAGTDLRFDKGRLAARGPGRIAYDPANPPAFMDPQSNSSVALAMQALQNFNYKALAVTVDGAAGREMTVTLKVDGANPDFYGGYPVALNVNLSGALGSIVRAGLGSYNLPDAVRERIEQYSQEGASAQ
ncbi:MAG TPA: YdbH domain-containing protein [Azospirillaceae bacterium]|nr:YdbH domain-containing protein [Azospirillaceae bacterium]